MRIELKIYAKLQHTLAVQPCILPVFSFIKWQIFPPATVNFRMHAIVTVQRFGGVLQPSAISSVYAGSELQLNGPGKT